MHITEDAIIPIGYQMESKRSYHQSNPYEPVSTSFHSYIRIIVLTSLIDIILQM